MQRIELKRSILKYDIHFLSDNFIDMFNSSKFIIILNLNIYYAYFRLFLKQLEMCDNSNFPIEIWPWLFPMQRTCGFISLILSAISITLILTKSPNAMKDYKYFILAVQISTTLADISINLLGNYVILFPSNQFCQRMFKMRFKNSL